MRPLRRLSYWLHRRSLAAELDEELRVHEEMKRDALKSGGMSSDEAHSAARAAMGNMTYMREASRAVWIGTWLESIGQDLTFTGRTLRRNIGFACVAVIVLAAAIGLNSSVFTLFSGLVLRPWPVLEPRRMLHAYASECCDRAGGQPHGFPLAEIEYLRQRSTSIEAAAVSRQTGDKLPASGRADEGTELSAGWVNERYFSALGVKPAAGRVFATDETIVSGTVPSVVLSYAYWRSRFGEDRLIVGQLLDVGGAQARVIGVAPEGFTGISAERADVWLPLSAAPLLMPEDRWASRVATRPDNCCTRLAVRLRAGVSRETARRELSALHRQFLTEHPGAGGGPMPSTSPAQIELSDFSVVGSEFGGARAVAPLLQLLFACAIAVLLLACANVGNLLLARAAARQREIAIRLSLGASRARVVRQLLTESMALAFVAGALGIGISYWLPGRLMPLLGAGFLTAGHRPDSAVLVYSLAVSVSACLIFGVAPALHATKSLRAAATRLSLRSWFLAAQVAMSTIILVAAGLLIRGVQRAGGTDLGFRANEVAALSFELPRDVGPTSPQAQALGRTVRQLVDGLGAETPVALSRYTPLRSVGKGTVTLPDNIEQDILVEEVSPRYFQVLGIPLRSGRTFSSSEDPGIVINQSLSRQLGGTAQSVGRFVRFGGLKVVIVGVVANAKTTFTMDEAEPTVYRALVPDGLPIVLAPSKSPVAEQVMAAVRRTDRRVKGTVTALAQYFDARMASSRLRAGMAAGVGAVALLLASLGLFGVCAYWVQQRTREIGVRMALGATPGSVIALVVGMSARAMTSGLAIGLVGAFAASRLLRGFIFGLSATDPVAFGAVIALMIIAGALSTYLPALRAVRIDPTTALRQD